MSRGFTKPINKVSPIKGVTQTTVQAPLYTAADLMGLVGPDEEVQIDYTPKNDGTYSMTVSRRTRMDGFTPSYSESEAEDQESDAKSSLLAALILMAGIALVLSLFIGGGHQTKAAPQHQISHRRIP